MEFKNCRICEKLFASSGNLTCPDCLEKLDEVYQKARTAIRDNRKEKLSIERLAELIEEDEIYIGILVEEGRISMGDTSSGEENKCAMCGASVFPGEKYCDRCKASLISGFNKKDDEKHSRMFTQERRKR